MHVELMLRDKTRVHVDVADVEALQAEVDALINRSGKYANGWVLVDNDTRYVAYSEIQQIRPVVRE
jgi:hypothetical protein